MADTRNTCRHCGVKTWSTDYAAFMRDHDRPDGRVCRAAQEEQRKLAMHARFSSVMDKLSKLGE